MILKCLSITILTVGTFFGSDHRDFKSMKRSAEVCRTDNRYTNTPCLTKYIKREDGVYWAICGVKQIGEISDNQTTRK